MLFRLPSREGCQVGSCTCVYETRIQEKLAEPSLRDLKTMGAITLGQDEITKRLSGQKRTEH